MDNFVTWELVGTFVGCVAVVTALTEIAKQLFALNPKWISLLFSVVLVVGGGILQGQTAPADLFLLAINALVVCGSATGLYKHIVEPVETALKQ